MAQVVTPFAVYWKNRHVSAQKTGAKYRCWQRFTTQTIIPFAVYWWNGYVSARKTRASANIGIVYLEKLSAEKNRDLHTE